MEVFMAAKIQGVKSDIDQILNNERAIKIFEECLREQHKTENLEFLKDFQKLKQVYDAGNMGEANSLMRVLYHTYIDDSGKKMNVNINDAMLNTFKRQVKSGFEYNTFVIAANEVKDLLSTNMNDVYKRTENGKNLVLELEKNRLLRALDPQISAFQKYRSEKKGKKVITTSATEKNVDNLSKHLNLDTSKYNPKQIEAYQQETDRLLGEIKKSLTKKQGKQEPVVKTDLLQVVEKQINYRNQNKGDALEEDKDEDEEANIETFAQRAAREEAEEILAEQKRERETRERHAREDKERLETPMAAPPPSPIPTSRSASSPTPASPGAAAIPFARSETAPSPRVAGVGAAHAAPPPPKVAPPTPPPSPTAAIPSVPAAPGAAAAPPQRPTVAAPARPAGPPPQYVTQIGNREADKAHGMFLGMQDLHATIKRKETSNEPQAPAAAGEDKESAEDKASKDKTKSPRGGS